MDAIYKISAYALIFAAFSLIIYTRFTGLHYTESELLLNYWKEYLLSIVLIGASLWLTTKFR